MTSIYKTAYPYYSDKKKIAIELIAKDYRLTHEEVSLVKTQSPKNIDTQLCFAVMLMVFKNLTYFAELSKIPKAIVSTIQDQLQLPHSKLNNCHRSTVSRYRQRVYRYYGFTSWKVNQKINPLAKSLAETSATEASKYHNYPADIINIVVEEFKRNSFELPPFNTLDRIVKHVRANINQGLFKGVNNLLTEEQTSLFDKLLKTQDDYQRSAFNELKALPKNPTITNFRELISYHDWLSSLGEADVYLNSIIPIKRKQFAEQARSLDASNLRDFAPSKRYALILCLISDAQSRAKDALGTTFCRTVVSMHKKSKEKLEQLREHYRERTQALLAIFSTVLGSLQSEDTMNHSMEAAYDTITNNGGAEALKADCDQAMALNSNNHLPFMMTYFKGKRSALFKLVETVKLRSSTQSNIITEAIQFIVDNKKNRSDYITGEIDLSFTTEQWRKMILKKEGDQQLLHHRYLEACVFSHVTDELRSKDLFIVGSDSYADYRIQLLPMSECEAKINAYCEEVSIANNSCDYVAQMKAALQAN